MWKRCNNCGHLVLVPKKTEENIIKCENCGAEVFLRKKKRNGMTKGLKGEFMLEPSFFQFR